MNYNLDSGLQLHNLLKIVNQTISIDYITITILLYYYTVSSESYNLSSAVHWKTKGCFFSSQESLKVFSF
jgi:hypothetical protein